MRSVQSLKIVEMLRLRSLGLSQRQIAQSSGCAKSTVGDTLKRCADVSLDYETAKTMSDEALQVLLYPKNANATRIPDPDWDAVSKKLSRRKKLNLQYLWEEYRKENPTGLSYSQYCARYRKYRKDSEKSISLHEERVAGEVLQVDWIGDVMPCVHDPKTKITQDAHFFVSVLGVSGYPYVEAFPDEKEISWVQAHVNALDYYNGLPRILRPDNCKTAVKTPKYYEPDINSAYWDFSQHYGIAVLPARSRKPKDKSLVEESIGWLETWLLEYLHGQEFFSFYELNEAISERVEELVRRPFKKKKGTRLSVFEEIDKPALRPLPERYIVAEMITRRVSDNLHVEYASFYYSVPFKHHKEQVILRATPLTIEIIDKNQNRIASHKRRYKGPSYVTETSHLPKSHQFVKRFREFDGTRYRNWAKSIGDSTYFVINSLLTESEAEEQGYKSCMGILQSSKKYGEERLEAACGMAMNLGSCRFSTVSNILKKGLDKLPAVSEKPTPEHENIRGSEYYV